jgi:predicted anti-sigma-YlaC factor YlaD
LAAPDDLIDVDDPRTGCDRARELVSAALDGAVDEGDSAVWARWHVAGCADCAGWVERAARLDRLLRISLAAADEPDLAEAILAQVRLPRRGRWRPAMRAALAMVALAQLAIGLTSLFGPVGMAMTMSMPPSSHMDHEEAAFNIAFGIALGMVAWSRRRAGGQVPVLASFVLVLAVSSVFDLSDGAVTWSRLLTHLPILLGLLLATALGRMPESAPGPRRTASYHQVGPRRWWRTAAEVTRIGHTRTPHGHTRTPHGHTPPAARRDVA